MIRCGECGRFLGYAEMENGTASFHYTPDAEGSRERCDWTCAKCTLKNVERLDTADDETLYIP